MPDALSLFAFWQFGSAAMLLIAAFAAIPLLIHLLSKLRAREVRFAAMEFLLAAARKHSRRLQLQQWLLLLLRTLVVLFLALAMADPFLAGFANSNPRGEAAQQLILFVIDSSYSMECRDAQSAEVASAPPGQTLPPAALLLSASGRSRFDEARLRIQTQVESSRQGDGFLLVEMGDPPRAIISQPAFAPADVMEEVASLSQQQRGADLATTLALVETLLDDAARDYPLLKSRRVIVYTDLGKNSWGDIASRQAAAKLKEIQSLATLSLVELGSRETGNMAITSIVAEEPVARLGSPFSVTVELQNYSADDVSDRALQLKVDGSLVAEQLVTAAAGAKITATFNAALSAPGEHLLEFQLADDPLLIDNRRWLAMQAHPAVSVLLVGSRRESTSNLAYALSPDPLTNSDFAVTQILESSLRETSLAQFDCVMLCEIARITDDEANLIADYVNSGGGLIIVLGHDADLESYNRELAEERQLLPATLAGVSDQGDFRVDVLDYRHEIAQPFRGHDRSGLLSIPIWRHQRLTLTPQGVSALSLSDGSPLIADGRKGRGRVLITAIPASGDVIDTLLDPPGPWSAWSAWPSFPPIVHCLVDAAISPQLSARNVLVGDDISGQIPAEAMASEITISLPDGSEQRITASPTSRSFWQFAGTSEAGAYIVSFVGGDPQLSQVIAANVDTKESDLARIDSASLPAEIRPSETNTVNQPTSKQEANTPLFRWMLLLVLTAVVAESSLAWKLGRGTAR